MCRTVYNYPGLDVLPSAAHPGLSPSPRFQFSLKLPENHRLEMRDYSLARARGLRRIATVEHSKPPLDGTELYGNIAGRVVSSVHALMPGNTQVSWVRCPANRVKFATRWCCSN